MTNLVTLHVEEFQQVRGQRRKLTKALIVISTLTPVSGDSRNLPLIVLEALKDILCEFREARTRRQPWRPMQEFLSTSKQCPRIHPRQPREQTASGKPQNGQPPPNYPKELLRHPNNAKRKCASRRDEPRPFSANKQARNTHQTSTKSRISG